MLYIAEEWSKFLKVRIFIYFLTFLDGATDTCSENAVPIANCGLHLDDETLRLAVGVRLGTKICYSHTCPCGALVDELGLHCFVCRKGNGKQTRHSLFNEVI